MENLKVKIARGCRMWVVCFDRVTYVVPSFAFLSYSYLISICVQVYNSLLFFPLVLFSMKNEMNINIVGFPSGIFSPNRDNF